MESRNGEPGWYSIAQEQLEETNVLQKKAKVVAVVMQEGFTNICFMRIITRFLSKKSSWPCQRSWFYKEPRKGRLSLSRIQQSFSLALL
jgi:hypothetical protein